MIDKFKMGRSRYSLAKLWAYLAIQETALVGDMVVVCTPAALGSSAAAVNAAIGGAAAKFTRTIEISLQNAAGDVHTWFNGSLAIAASEVTAGNGVSAIEDGATTIDFVEGVATVTVEYTGAWSGGTKQVETQQITHKADAAGTVTVTVTAAGMANSSKAVALEVAQDDTAIQVAGKIVAALNADADVSSKFVASNGGTDTVTLTAKTAVANDGTLAMGFVDTDTTGVTAGASTNATAGVAADTQTLTITGGTILGYAVTNKTSVDTLVA